MVSTFYFALTRRLFPGCEWRASEPRCPIFALLQGEVVAVLAGVTFREEGEVDAERVHVAPVGKGRHH